jgi:hypothetical protein
MAIRESLPSHRTNPLHAPPQVWGLDQCAEAALLLLSAAQTGLPSSRALLAGISGLRLWYMTCTSLGAFGMSAYEESPEMAARPADE